MPGERADRPTSLYEVTSGQTIFAIGAAAPLITEHGTTPHHVRHGSLPSPRLDFPRDGQNLESI